MLTSPAAFPQAKNSPLGEKLKQFTVASEGKFETLFPSRATSITGCDPMETSEIGGEKICPPAADVRRCLPPFEICRSRKVEPSDTDLCTSLIFPVDPPGAKAVSGKLIRKRV
jgi:hypothetical protein